MRSRRGHPFVGLLWGQLFCSPKDAITSMPENEIGLGIVVSLFGLPGFRFRPFFYLRLCEGGTGFDRAIKVTRPSATEAWYNYSIDVRTLAKVIVNTQPTPPAVSLSESARGLEQGEHTCRY